WIEELGCAPQEQLGGPPLLVELLLVAHYPFSHLLLSSYNTPMQKVELDLRAAPLARRGLLEVEPNQLRAWLLERGQPPMRARQLRRWLCAGRAESFEQMTDLPRGLRQELAETFLPLGTSIERHLVSCDGTHKLLLRLQDGNVVECVLLQEADRRTVCISTQ